MCYYTTKKDEVVLFFVSLPLHPLLHIIVFFIFPLPPSPFVISLFFFSSPPPLFLSLFIFYIYFFIVIIPSSQHHHHFLLLLPPHCCYCIYTNYYYYCYLILCGRCQPHTVGGGLPCHGTPLASYFLSGFDFVRGTSLPQIQTILFGSKVRCLVHVLTTTMRRSIIFSSRCSLSSLHLFPTTLCNASYLF